MSSRHGANGLGVLSATDGYAFSGKLEVGSNVVGLNDADLAVLGVESTIDGGTLSSFNGILIQPGKKNPPEQRVKSIAGDGTVGGYVYLNGSYIAGTLRLITSCSTAWWRPLGR